ncbi:hypothetical protein TI04_04175 [Achromatium sp. WMS2]|nr:hypothetical protein TI04_04175 [Achromatium sp. WMS2]
MTALLKRFGNKTDKMHGYKTRLRYTLFSSGTYGFIPMAHELAQLACNFGMELNSIKLLL